MQPLFPTRIQPCSVASEAQTVAIGATGRARIAKCLQVRADQERRRLPIFRNRQCGVGLVEIVIGLVIVGILLARGAPAFGSWIQNTRIRAAGEAIQNGLMLARAEAVRRNDLVRFQLVDSVSNTCALSTTASNWVVSMDDPSGACASAPSNTTAPRIIQMRSAAEGSANVTVAAGQSAVVFNGLGQLAPVPAGAIAVNLSNPTGGACAPAGEMRCMRVEVSTGGQIRMCDPALASTDPQGC